MSSVRLSGSSSGYYDLTVPAAAGTNSIDLSTLVTNNHTGNVTLNGALTQTKSGDSQLKVISTSNNTFAQVLVQDANAGYSWQVRSDGAQSTPTGSFLLNDQRGTFPIIIEENNATDTLRLSNGRVTTPLQPSFLVRHNANSFTTTANQYFPFDSKTIYGGYDVGGHYNTSTYLYTVPVTGTYFFHAYTICSTTLSNGQWNIRKNGGAIHDHHISQPSTSWYHHTLTITTQCAANDTIGVYVAGAYAFYGLSWSGFMGYLLG